VVWSVAVTPPVVWLATGTKMGVVVVLRRRAGSSFLGGGCFLRAGLGTAAATSSVTGAVLVCDCWWNWWDDWWYW
jgi:hypothetical protein